ncbi:MAG: hypothetical protein ACI8X5_003538 [Planctomycetota bacterium]|jgi:hypothetical protein
MANGLLSPEAGTLFSIVEHEGNTQASNEEVNRIKAFARDLLGRTKVDKHGKNYGPLKLEDILFVAPFNMQVQRPQEATPDARVASVDKFQG